MNKWKLDKTLPREVVILAIVFMKTIHRRGYSRS